MMSHQPAKEMQAKCAGLRSVGEKVVSFRQAEFEVPEKHISVS